VLAITTDSATENYRSERAKSKGENVR